MNHYYSFEHGEELTAMGASWFVSYSWFRYVDRTHLNWKKVKSYPSRISMYIRTKEYHKFYLEQIVKMSEKLSTNKIGLTKNEVISKAKELLINYFR